LIDQKNVKKEGFIKNTESKKTPQVFEYRANMQAEIQQFDISKLMEVGIYDRSKFITATLNIDRSGENINSLSDSSLPQFEKETLILEVLQEGAATLFLYNDGRVNRYFFSKESIPKQLIYKLYRRQGNTFSRSYQFRQQLSNEINCTGIDDKVFENIKYQKRDLQNIFKKFDECEGITTAIYKKKQERDWFNLSIRPGVTFSSLDIKNGTFNSRDRSYGEHTSFRLGLEAEFILPFNRNKWALVVEPTYRTYEGMTANGFEAEYTSVEIPIGVRHYLFFNGNSKLFINGMAVIDSPFEKTVDRYDLNTAVNFAVELVSNIKIATA
jgi:hypothetical protein